MQLTDGTIVVRPPVEHDLEDLADAVRSSITELARYMPWAAGDYDPADTLAWIRRAENDDERNFVIVDRQHVIVGSGGLSQINRINQFANLGYWVRSDRYGHGFATRATLLLTRWAFDVLKLGRIEILMSVENEPSRRVAERAGAHYEGVLRNRLLLHDRYHDAHIFSFVPGDLDDRTD